MSIDLAAAQRTGGEISQHEKKHGGGNLNVRWRCITAYSPFGNTVCGIAGRLRTHRRTSPVIFPSELGSLPDSFLLPHDLRAHDWRRTRQWRPGSHAPKRHWSSAPAEMKHRRGDTADDGRAAARRTGGQENHSQGGYLRQRPERGGKRARQREGQTPARARSRANGDWAATQPTGSGVRQQKRHHYHCGETTYDGRCSGPTHSLSGLLRTILCLRAESSTRSRTAASPTVLPI